MKVQQIQISRQRAWLTEPGLPAKGNMPKRIFKLNTPTLAIHADKDHRTIVTIPANALVTVVVGDMKADDGFVRVRYRDEALMMFVEDLRARGEQVCEQSA